MENLYKSEEWKSLDEIDRAQLLLVIEGLKKGTIVGGNWTSFMDVLKKTELDYELISDGRLLEPVFKVAKTRDLLDQHGEYLALPENFDPNDFHRISGKFLGYPKCCTEEYVKDPTFEQIMAARRGDNHLTYKFGEEMGDKIKEDGIYSDVFDYCPPSFTPCGIECPEAKKVLTSWKDAINTFDPEAGKELVYFNRGSLPERFAHKEYLKQEESRRDLEYTLREVRESVR